MEQPTKASLRTQARNLLASLTPQAQAAASEEVCRRIMGMAEWAAASMVALYAAQASEPDLRALLEQRGKAFCFPRVCGEGLEFHRCASMELLQPGPWKLLEPDAAGCPVVAAGEIDMILVPGMAFTKTGGRLGRGGGYYDRFLIGAHPRALKVGTCFHAQVVEELPLESHDHEVDLVVTETEVIRCGR